MFKKEPKPIIPKFKLNIYNVEHQVIIRDFERDLIAEKQQYPSLTFEEYLIHQGAWTIDDSYPNGAIKDITKYQETCEKYNALNHLHWLQEKNTMSPQERREILDNMRQVLNKEFSTADLLTLETKGV